MYTKGIAAVLYRIQTSIETSYHTTISQESIDSMLENLRVLVEIGEGISLLRAYILCWFQDNWEGFPIEWRLHYNNQFVIFACRQTGRKWSILEEHMDVARIFLIDNLQPDKGVVSMPVRDKHGKAIKDEAGAPETAITPWNPVTASMTKLRAIRRLAQADIMTDELWAMTMDRQVVVEDIRREIYGGSGSVGGDRESNTLSNRLMFRIEGPLLLAERNGEVAEIGELAFDLWQEPLVRDAIKHILQYLQISMDEDVIMAITRKSEVRNAYHKNR